jgi:hypothetical protein
MTTDNNQTTQQSIWQKSELSTLDNFRTLFTTFWVSLGRANHPTEASILAYWEKLKTYPEKILMDMFDQYLQDGDSKCPAVGEMVTHCRDRMSYYRSQVQRWREQREQERQMGIQPEDADYRIAVRDAVFEIMRKRGLEIEDRHKRIREAVERLAKEHGKPVMGEYLAWK